jgi:hypothetical protein
VSHGSAYARIGAHRNRCATCNRFAQNVRRLTLNALVAAYPADYAAARYRAEHDLYPLVMEAWLASHPAPDSLVSGSTAS